jgi:hypothetical protein
MRARSPILAILSVALALISYSAGQLAGSIRGMVVDEKNVPIPAAQVRVDPLDSRPRADVVLLVETDGSGHFSVNNLQLQSYKIFAMKEPSGYPNTAFGFYSNNFFPIVTLSASVPTADITLKLGPPDGVISGSVTDAVTGAPVPTGFLLRRISDPDNWISMSQKANYRVLVPPSVEVSVEVSAPGYKTWYYGESSDPMKRNPIRLESREEMKLDIQLQPENKTEKRP